MRTSTNTEVWDPEDPLVVFIVPADGGQNYAATTNRVVVRALQWLDRPLDSIEFVGLLTASPAHSIEAVAMLDDIGLDPRSIILVMLWGDTADDIGAEGDVDEECGIGFIALPESGVVLPAVRMPSMDGYWWEDPMNEEYAVAMCIELLQDGRVRPEEGDTIVFPSNTAVWN